MVLLLPDQNQLLQLQSICFRSKLTSDQCAYFHHSPFQGFFCLLWRSFCSLCADCSCVPVLLPDLLYPSFTPRHLPISMQPREYTEYKYTTVTLYNISKGTLHNQKVQTTLCTGFTTNGSCSCTCYLSTARSCNMTIQITRDFLFLYFFISSR